MVFCCFIGGLIRWIATSAGTLFIGVQRGVYIYLVLLLLGYEHVVSSFLVFIVGQILCELCLNKVVLKNII